MDFDHTYHGAADWSFPSPTATPTTTSFNHHAFETPKAASFSSHFNDAFSTPHMPSYATLRPVDYATMTALDEQQRAQEAMHNQYYAHMHQAGGPINAGQPMPPPPTHTPSQQQFQGQMMSPMYAHSQAPPMPVGTAMHFDTSQMQTPPPTRGTSVKKPDPNQIIAFGTPSTIASRRFATPQQMPVSNQQVPNAQYAAMPFPQLQFPSEVYQFGNMGPASAPVLPQTQLLWDQTASPTMYSQQNVLDDPFAPAVSSSMGWPSVSAQAVSFNTPAMVSFPTQMPMQRPASAAPVVPSTQQQQPHLSPPVMSAAGVDPSLVYSSPIRPVMPSSTPQAKQLQSSAPMTEPKRKDSGMIDHKRSDTVSSGDSTITVAPKALRRSNTTGTARPLSAHPSIREDPAISRSNSVLHAPRTASPLKRIGKSPLGSISEKRTPSFRRSVILTIDESGRARTETFPSEPSPTKSVRDRYPGLFDSDSSDEELEEEDKSPSRSASFSFARGDERRTKAARLDPPIENLEGLNIPRSSSSASMRVTPSRAAIAAAAQLRRGGSLRKQTPSKTPQKRAQATSASATSIDTAPMDLGAADRQQGLSPEEDWYSNNHNNNNSLEAHNRRWSMMSLDQQQQQASVSPTHPPEFQPIHYPPPRRQQPQRQGRRLLRCTCGVAEEQGQVLVQCRSCTQWCHAGCVGALPQSYFTCFLCTKPTTSLQMGRA